MGMTTLLNSAKAACVRPLEQGRLPERCEVLDIGHDRLGFTGERNIYIFSHTGVTSTLEREFRMR